MKILIVLVLAGSTLQAAPQYGLDKRPSLKGLRFPATLPLSSRYEFVPAFSNLEFHKALFLTFAPEDPKLYVVEQGGKILRFANDANVASASLFLDLGPKISSSNGEEGLLGLAFDSAYASSGYFFVNYTAPSPLRTVISRFKATNGTVDPHSEKMILEIRQPYSNHNGGMLAFGPDGMLYIGMGDGGSGGDPQGNGQNKNALLGKILRIDPLHGSPYQIPSDNPFVGVAGVRGEIWALGLRNPWRFSFDKQTGELWVGDVGQDAWEEVDVVRKGDNLGWNTCEGNHKYQGGGGACPSTFRAPLVEYSHSEGRSITGGYVYRGSRLSGLKGFYLYGDYESRAVWAVQKNQDQVISKSKLGTAPELLSSFGEDANGEIYFLGYGNQSAIYKIEARSGPTPQFPQQLSKTGLFERLLPLVPNSGLIEYEVAVPLWSDGAKKKDG